MHAWRMHQTGEPEEVMRFESFDLPKPGPSEILVDVAAAAVNFPDLLICRGTYHHRPELPVTLGSEAAGVVRAVGTGTDVQIGTRVLSAPLAYGCFAEQMLVDAKDVFPVPDAMPWSLASSLFIAYQTSHVALFRRGRLKAGETLLVHGGAGAVGSAAIELGKSIGATVIATAGNQAKLDVCSQIGADVVINYTEGDFVDHVKDATQGRGADVILDPVGGDVFDRSRKCVAFEGRMLIIGFASGSIPTLAANHPLMKNYEVAGVRLQPYRENRQLALSVHNELLELFQNGDIGGVPVGELSLDSAPKAISLLGQRKVAGRLVLRNQ